MKMLILHFDADYMKKVLEPKFPELTMQAETYEGNVGDFIEEAEILMAISFSDEFMQRARKVKWIQCIISGIDRILELPSLREDILLTSAKGIHGPQMSELAFLHMLNLNRNYQQMYRNQQKGIWERWPQPLLYKKSVGILGLGVIGKELARKCKTFGMTVYGIAHWKREFEDVDYSYGPEGLLEVMSKVDFFINILPSTPETKDLIGERELSALKPTAFFINIGRGETVDLDALIKLLKERKFAGAGLDIFTTSSLPKDNPLWSMDNVMITPQVGGMSDVYADQALPIFEENLRRYLKGERTNLINFIEWSK
jgi:phosphoglycerate dehydrogenase-like enzyme